MPCREFLVWFAAGDEKHFERFRAEELQAVGVMVAPGGPGLFVEPVAEGAPYALIRLPDEEAAKKVAQRAVLVQAVYEVWAEGKTIQELEEKVTAAAQEREKRALLDSTASLCMRTRAYGKKMSNTENRSVIGSFMQKLHYAGSIQMTQPETTMMLLLDFGHHESKLHKTRRQLHDMKRGFFGRRITESQRAPFLHRYDLRTRRYIGTTSTKAELAFLMANQIHARPGTLVYDPFVGTGSLLVAAAVFGSTVFGSDIDIRVLYNKELQKGIRDNFEQYGLPMPCLIRSDNSNPVWKPSVQFDGIICDPPYGVREGARKTGTTKPVTKIPEQFLATHCPRTQSYDAVELMNDLLNFAARHLVMGGRLAYLLPTTAEYTEAEVPTHPCFNIIGNSEQKLAAKFARRLITMEKIKEAEEYNNVPVSTPSFATVRTMMTPAAKRQDCSPVEQEPVAKK